MNKDLHILGLTGGIATGKSTCVGVFRELLPEVVVFDADASVRSLYEDQSILTELLSYFGPDALLEDGSGNKSYLRRRAFSEASDKRFLEQLFHGRVREDCLALLAQTVTKGVSRLFVADVPLLFENGFDFGQSANLLVATSRKTQVDRLTQRNKWDQDMVQAVLASQMPIEAKHALADVVFWNEGPLEMLRKQCFRHLQALGLLR